jgi:16S rRNA (cytosine1402-N4)-methyltransferase
MLTHWLSVLAQSECYSMHIPVLLQESVDSLAVQPSDIVVDGTFGGGGHSGLIRTLLKGKGKLISVDLDELAEDRFKAQFATDTQAQFVHANFKDAAVILVAAGVDHADKVLLDLGTSTFQLLADTRGFSFHSDTPLTMTFSEAGSHTGFTAGDIVNNWEESSIADIIFWYGEEKSARTIARAIVAARSIEPIKTAKQLADIIEAAVRRRGRLHPATKTFQALRIAANDELGVLTTAMQAWWEALSHHGRLSIITFHSLEDRLVKQWMKSQTNAHIITKKPITPSLEELSHNPRSRSAKLRTIEKIA